MSNCLGDSGEEVQHSDVSMELKFPQFLRANFRSRMIPTQTKGIVKQTNNQTMQMFVYLIKTGHYRLLSFLSKLTKWQAYTNLKRQIWDYHKHHHMKVYMGVGKNLHELQM